MAWSPIEQYNTKDSRPTIKFNTLKELSTGCKSGCIIMETVVSLIKRIQLKLETLHSKGKASRAQQRKKRKSSHLTRTANHRAAVPANYHLPPTHLLSPHTPLAHCSPLGTVVLFCLLLFFLFSCDFVLWGENYIHSVFVSRKKSVLIYYKGSIYSLK